MMMSAVRPAYQNRHHKAKILSTYTEVFSSCCKCTRDGFGGAVLSHAGCFMMPGISGALGGSLSGAFMVTAMYVASPIIAMGATSLLDIKRGHQISLTRLFGSAVIALGISFGINSFIGHDHEMHEHHHENSALSWFDQQTPEMRQQISKGAQELGLPLLEYIDHICTQPPDIAPL